MFRINTSAEPVDSPQIRNPKNHTFGRSVGPIISNVYLVSGQIDMTRLIVLCRARVIGYTYRCESFCVAPKTRVVCISSWKKKKKNVAPFDRAFSRCYAVHIACRGNAKRFYFGKFEILYEWGRSFINNSTSIIMEAIVFLVCYSINFCAFTAH